MLPAILILFALLLAVVLPGLIAADHRESPLDRRLRELAEGCEPDPDPAPFEVRWSGYTAGEQTWSGAHLVVWFPGDWPLAQCQLCGEWFDTEAGAVFHVMIAHADDPRTEARHAHAAV